MAQRAEAPPVRQAVTYKVHTPPLILPCDVAPDRFSAGDPFPLPPWHLQSQLFCDAGYPALPDHHTIAPQQRCDATVTEAWPLGRELLHSLAQTVVHYRLGSVAIAGSRLCPTSPQARRSLVPCTCRKCATADLFSSGLTIFFNQILQHREPYQGFGCRHHAPR